VAIADVRHERLAAGAQIVERIEMSAGQIVDVNVIAYAGAVGCRIVGAENREVRSLANRRLAGDLDEQCGGARRLADAAVRIRSGHVEVPQHDVTQGRGRETSRNIHSDISFEVP
jgi:hypothetical protein